jgi:2-methylcitrate dehydratase PrpD
MAKIAVAEDQALSKAYPGKSGCSIEVTLADGTKLQASRDHPKGDPADPLTDAEIEDKFRQYFFFAESSLEADAIINRLWTLDHQTGLEWLVAPLKRRVEAVAKAARSTA